MINIDIEKLEHAYEVLKGKPWESREDLLARLQYLIDFHKYMAKKFFKIIG